MKQFYRIIPSCLIVMALACVAASAQVNISTKRVKIADFQTKTTKVVLTGDPVFDAALKSEVSRRWRISPFEYVTFDEYNSVKTNNNYYFLMLQDWTDGKSGVSMLSLFKGGDQENPKSEGAVINVIDFPFCPVDGSDGREYVFLSAVIDIIQNYTLEAMKSDRVGYGGIEAFATKVGRTPGQKVYFCEEDIDPELLFDPLWEKKGVFVVSAEEADAKFMEETEGNLVSYTVSPSNPERRSYCYKMLIDAGTHELCYFGKHQVGVSDRTGFGTSEVTSIVKRMK